MKMMFQFNQYKITPLFILNNQYVIEITTNRAYADFDDGTSQSCHPKLTVRRWEKEDLVPFECGWRITDRYDRDIIGGRTHSGYTQFAALADGTYVLSLDVD